MNSRPASLRRPLVAVLAAGALLLAAGCSEDESTAPTVTGTVDTGPVTQPTSVKITPVEGAAFVQEMGESLTIIDVRTPEEFAAGHLEGAINVDIESGQFSARIEGLDHTATYMVYCHSGRRSAIATDTMVTAGFTEVYDVGGIADWIAAGLPVVTD
ncbi:MAG: rhodanese-like domain-containing protein [Ilumatobacteraceae bacterium]